jgi:zona occludens toxin (predicted ATPase)
MADVRGSSGNADETLPPFLSLYKASAAEEVTAVPALPSIKASALPHLIFSNISKAPVPAMAPVLPRAHTVSHRRITVSHPRAQEVNSVGLRRHWE